MVIADWEYGPSAILSYSFESPETTTVIEEYLIMNTMQFIGSIGGTIGVFTGLSFFDAVSTLIELCKFLQMKFVKGILSINLSFIKNVFS